MSRGGTRTVRLSDDESFRRRIERGREALENKLAQGEVIYGVNTGFGGNARYVIPDDEVAHHQRNLLEFLSCGVGEPLSEEAVRAAILLRANALARGLSAVRMLVIERLLDLLEPADHADGSALTVPWARAAIFAPPRTLRGPWRAG